MNYTDAMLSTNCSNPAPVPWSSNVSIYHFTGHCMEYEIYATPNGDLTYTLYTMKMKDI